MQRLEVSGAVRPIYGSLGVKWLTCPRAGKLRHSRCLQLREATPFPCKAPTPTPGPIHLASDSMGTRGTFPEGV